MGYWVDWQVQWWALREIYIEEVFKPVKTFPLLYPGHFLLPPGAYNHIMNSINID